MASPMPVLPLVGSTSVPPGFSAPPRSASSTMATAMRSLTLPPGFNDSTFAITVRFERATGALDGRKDGAHGARFRRTSQMVTPGGPPFRGEQPRALEREQHLFQVALGDGLPRRDLLDGDETTSVVQGQVEH